MPLIYVKLYFSYSSVFELQKNITGQTKRHWPFSSGAYPDSKLQRTDSVPHSAAGSATAAAAECGPTTNLAEAPPTARLRRSGAGKQAPVRRRLAGAGPELGLQMRASIFILFYTFSLLSYRCIQWHPSTFIY